MMGITLSLLASSNAASAPNYSAIAQSLSVIGNDMQTYTDMKMQEAAEANNRGVDLVQAGDLQGAKAAFEESVADYPFPEAQRNLAGLNEIFAATQKGVDQANQQIQASHDAEAAALAAGRSGVAALDALQWPHP
jgi:hypothetical protein